MEHAAVILNAVSVLVTIDVVFGIVAFVAEKNVMENGIIDN
jgi:hypothetical protein